LPAIGTADRFRKRLKIKARIKKFARAFISENIQKNLKISMRQLNFSNGCRRKNQTKKGDIK
jgi:hypothetical protein